MVKPNGQDDGSARIKILLAARQEFIVSGLKGARMQQIADRAGFNKALLHYHFGDKESLYSATVQSVLETIKGAVIATLPLSHGPIKVENQIENTVRAYITVLKENPDLVGLVLRELSDGGHHFDPLVEKFSASFRQILQSMFKNLDLNHTKSPQYIMINLMTMVWGTFLLQPLYTKIARSAGVPLIIDNKFYEDRIQMISKSTMHLLKEYKRNHNGSK